MGESFAALRSGAQRLKREMKIRSFESEDAKEDAKRRGETKLREALKDWAGNGAGDAWGTVGR
jgi:hypothetical protein